MLTGDDFCFIHTKKFAQEPFHPVPLYSVTKASSYRDAEARPAVFCRRKQKHEMRTMATFPVALKKEELFTSKQAYGLWK
jgi:hypothetical protein